MVSLYSHRVFDVRIAVVCGVMAASTFEGPKLSVFGSMSTNTGLIAFHRNKLNYVASVSMPMHRNEAKKDTSLRDRGERRGPARGGLEKHREADAARNLRPSRSRDDPTALPNLAGRNTFHGDDPLKPFPVVHKAIFAMEPGALQFAID